MRPLRAALFGLLIALPLVPTAAEAQDGTRRCRQASPSDFRRIVNSRGQEIVYFRDPVRFLCTGNVLLEADSAVVNRASSSVQLVGQVVYRDSTRELSADWANYLGATDQLLARGSARLKDLENGAIIRGEQLNYLRETEDRPLARLIVTGGRPHATLPPERPDTAVPGPRRPIQDLDRSPPVTPPALPVRPDTTADSTPGTTPDTTAVPTEIWADRMELLGDNLFLANGDVELERAELTGGGSSARFDRAVDQMTLTGNAFVQTDDYRLEGGRIDAFLEGEGIREVRSEDAARLASEELDVRSQRIRIGFADGELDRLEAWNPDSTTAGPRARADAQDFRLRADSIHAQADSLGIRELRAVGRAYGERDPSAGPADGPERRVVREPRTDSPSAIARDWIQGDTILAFFGRDTLPEIVNPPPPDEAADAADAVAGTEAGGDVVLERIVVVGGDAPALSLYRMEGDAPGAVPAINFMRAARIVLFMEEGEVDRVEAVGPIEGLYLDPAGGQTGGGTAGTVGGEESGE